MKSLPLRKFILPVFLISLISSTVMMSIIDSFRQPSLARAQSSTNSNINQTQSNIEAQVQIEYTKVYAAELAKGTPDAKAKKIAQAAADKKRKELTTAAAATGGYNNGSATGSPPKAQEAAGYVARSYDGVDWEGSLTITNPSKVKDISELVTKLINWLLLIIAMVATIVIIISGVMLVFNGGSEATIKQAKTTILWAIIGLVVSVGAFALVNIVQSLL